MNKYIFLLFFLLITSIQIYAQPKFTIVGGDEYNWGDVKVKDSPLKATIIFRNDGNTNLIITGVHPNCGCTAAKPSKDTIIPGDTTKMDISYNVSKATGVSSKHIRIETNDPKREKVAYRITANVVREISITPTSMRFQKIPVEVESSQSVKIKNNTDQTITFSLLKITPEDFKINTPDKFQIQPFEEIELIGSYTPPIANYQNGKIIFKTDNPDNPKVEISLQIQSQVPKEQDTPNN